jgi:hypothetical protein
MVSLLAFVPLHAENSGTQTKIEESFFGSDSASYALLRTETEFAHDEKKVRCRTWLDEYSKQEVILYKGSAAETDEAQIRNGFYGSKLERSVLLIDVTEGIDKPDVRDSTNDSSEEFVIHTQEPTTAISTLLLRYPHRSLKPWAAEQMGQLKYSDSSFFVFYKNQTMMSGIAIRERMGGVRMGDSDAEILIGPRTIDQVAEDENCAYLTITATTDKRVQTRIFCMVPRLTKNLHALQTRESLYLTTGRIDTKEEALKVAKNIQGKRDEDKEWAAIGIEVWGVNHSSYNKSFFCVAISNSMELIKKRQSQALSESLGIPLIPMDSDSFSVLVQRIPGATAP